MRRNLRTSMAIALVPLAGFGSFRVVDVGLRGSPASMERQHAIAKESEYTFTSTPEDVVESVRAGSLVPVEGNDDYWVKTTRHRYALPEVRLFIERLAAQYREATGEQLVVTSLTRPASQQPSNSHKLSVHPAGMAVDLRIPRVKAHREWLEKTLLYLEGEGVLDVTREKSPPHYHVAVFPKEYRTYAERRMAEEASKRAAEEAAAEARAVAASRAEASSGAPAAVAVAALGALGYVGWRKLRPIR